MVAGRLRGGIADGDLPAWAEPETLADLLIIVINGLSTRARDGASRAQLRRVADAVLASWPRRDDGIGERGE